MFLLASTRPWAFLPVQTAVCLLLGFLSKENSLNSLGTETMIHASQLAGDGWNGVSSAAATDDAEHCFGSHTPYHTVVFIAQNCFRWSCYFSSTESVLCPVQINNRTVWCPCSSRMKGLAAPRCLHQAVQESWKKRMFCSGMSTTVSIGMY